MNASTRNVRFGRPMYSAAVLGVVALWSMAAVAGPYAYDSNVGLTELHQCGVGDNTRYISDSDVTLGGNSASQCFGAYTGNDNFGPLLWNGNYWNEVDRLDVAGNGAIQSSDLITLFFNGSQSQGEWQYSGNYQNWDSFFVVTKASNDPGWAAYYFDQLPQNGLLSGFFTIPWNAGNSENPAGISHMTIYARNAVSVPEPGTLGLLGLGLMGMAVWRKRQ